MSTTTPRPPHPVNPYHLSPEGLAAVAAHAAQMRKHLAERRAARTVETLLQRVRGAR